jgi:large subunit ribosomal protein L15
MGFAGGQMPLFRVVAKRGFNNAAFADKVLAINLSTLEKHFSAGDEVSPQTLADKGLAKAQHDLIKILADGELTKKLVVKAQRFSKSAVEKIQAAGGNIEVLA